jgi:hypothetical protein
MPPKKICNFFGNGKVGCRNGSDCMFVHQIRHRSNKTGGVRNLPPINCSRQKQPSVAHVAPVAPFISSPLKNLTEEDDDYDDEVAAIYDAMILRLRVYLKKLKREMEAESILVSFSSAKEKFGREISKMEDKIKSMEPIV